MADEKNYDQMQPPGGTKAEARNAAREERLDDRLRSVEGRLIRVETQVSQLRDDIREGFIALNTTNRHDSCPHNSDFVEILNALKAGGKQFEHLEAGLDNAIRDRKRITDDHESRISCIEDNWTAAVTSVKTARWVVGFIGVATGWILSELVPFLKRLWEVQ